MNRYHIILILCILLWAPSIQVYAMEPKEDYYNDFDYDQIQSVIDDVIPSEEEFEFETYVEDLMSGKEVFSLEMIGVKIKDTIVTQVKSDFSILMKLLSVVIVAALFSNFSNAFKNNQVSETSFYITYLLLFSVLTSSFIAVTKLSSETLSKLLEFMKALVPTYFLAISFTSGPKSSLVYYEATLMLITFADALLINIILPMINIYMILILVNNISKEDYLSKFTELLSTLIRWSLKSLLGIVIGFNGIQGLILPVVDSVKKNLLVKASGSIPGVGGALETVTKTIYSTGILVKNAIGVTGLILIVLIVAVPLIKLATYTIIYKFGVALVQPITDKRILNCMNGVTQAASLLLYTVMIGAILFFITIAIITTSTSIGLGG